jgi:hypothetical protein
LAFPANPKLPETPPRYAPFGFAQEAWWSYSAYAMQPVKSEINWMNPSVKCQWIDFGKKTVENSRLRLLLDDHKLGLRQDSSIADRRTWTHSNCSVLFGLLPIQYFNIAGEKLFSVSMSSVHAKTAEISSSWPNPPKRLDNL